MTSSEALSQVTGCAGERSARDVPKSDFPRRTPMTDTPKPTLSDAERKLVAEALAMLPAGPWTVASSNSFRRINGPDGKDGGVLHAYTQRSDGHPDLSMSEQSLWALCRMVNAMPGLLTALEEAEGRAITGKDGVSWVRRSDRDEDVQALTARAEKAEQQAAERGEIIRRAQEELRLIRSKDTNAVYDTTLRLDMSLALSPSNSEADNHV